MNLAQSLVGGDQRFLPCVIYNASWTSPTPVTASLDTNRTCNARAPTSPRNIGFCAMCYCIISRSSSSSVRFTSVGIVVPNHHFLTLTREPLPRDTPQEQPAVRSDAHFPPEAPAKDRKAKKHDAVKARGPMLMPSPHHVPLLCCLLQGPQDGQGLRIGVLVAHGKRHGAEVRVLS